jgi:hypothetical protein
VKPSSLIDVQLPMVRLGKKFAWSALVATAFAWPAATAFAQVSNSPAAQPAATAKPAATTTPPPATQPQATTAHKSRVRRKKAEPVAEIPQTPPPPPTLEQQAPTAPFVSYRNGQLTINAPNSTLSSILRAVQLQTGASMDIPSGAGSERVATQIGPGLPRDVLNTLLNGSKFDYLILGVAGNPGGIQKVILTPKQAAGATATQTASAPQASSSDDSEDVSSADAGGESEYPGPQEQPTPPGAFRRPGGAPGGQSFQQQQQQQVNEDNPTPFATPNDPNIVKTPEQLMQELQQMQQQQQQYQEQLNPANQTPQ